MIYHGIYSILFLPKYNLKVIKYHDFSLMAHVRDVKNSITAINFRSITNRAQMRLKKNKQTSWNNSFSFLKVLQLIINTVVMSYLHNECKPSFYSQCSDNFITHSIRFFLKFLIEARLKNDRSVFSIHQQWYCCNMKTEK